MSCRACYRDDVIRECMSAWMFLPYLLILWFVYKQNSTTWGYQYIQHIIFTSMYKQIDVLHSLSFYLFSLSLSPAHFLSISHSVISKCFVANGSGNSTLWLCSKYKLSWYKYSIPTAAQTPQSNGTNVIITTTTANAKVF